MKAGIAALAATLTFALAGVASSSSGSYGLHLIHRTNLQVAALRACEAELGHRVWPPLRRRSAHVGDRERGLRTWTRRRVKTCGQVRYLNADPRRAIRYVFGCSMDPRSYCSAVTVSKCETGGTFWVGSHNGQYLGIFQMGSSERATYGHGRTALRQARAALRYFVASGRDWSPWDCRP